jgi:hypothetical protein
MRAPTSGGSAVLATVVVRRRRLETIDEDKHLAILTDIEQISTVLPVALRTRARACVS